MRNDSTHHAPHVLTTAGPRLALAFALAALLAGACGGGGGGGAAAPSLGADAGGGLHTDASGRAPDGPGHPTDGALAGADTGAGQAPDGASVLAPDSGAPAPDAAKPQKPLPRGLRWVRDNPMFISALVVQMGAPPASSVRDYFDAFGATALHLWETGLPSELNAWLAHRPGARWLSWTHGDGTNVMNKKVIGGVKPGHPGRVGYQIGDEPRDWKAFDEIKRGVVAVRKADPGALIVINYTYQAPMLGDFLDWHAKNPDADIFSYDQYTRSQGAYEHLERYRAYGLKSRKPYWRWIKSYADASGGNAKLDASDCRWDAFSGLVYGYTGHSWFLYQVRPQHQLLPGVFDKVGTYATAKKPLFHTIAALNRQMRHLGRAITQLTSTGVRYISSIGALVQPRGTRTWTRGAGGDRFITAIGAAPGQMFVDTLAGFFVDDHGERYVMVQNVRHKNGSFPVNLGGDATFELSFDFGAAPAVDATALLQLDQRDGKVKPLALASLGGRKARLRVTLAAGDVVFFKYKTSRGFALGR